MYPQSHCHSSRMQHFSHVQAQQKTGKLRHLPNHQMVLYPTLHRVAKPQKRMPPPAAGRCPTIPPPPRTPPSRTPRMNPSRHLISPPVPHRVTSSPLPYLRYERIGDPSLRVFRLQLPRELASRLDGIIAHSERHAQALPGGWKTDLYSLTKQDMALRDIPGMTQRIHPVFDYISQAIQVLYGCRKVVVDKNQPHILKYSIQSGHTGVELHHDRCDVTANLALSKSHEYEGGGTFFPDADGRVIRLEQGEFLLHPGSLVHGGMDVTSGTRYLMVMFAHLK